MGKEDYILQQNMDLAQLVQKGGKLEKRKIGLEEAFAQAVAQIKESFSPYRQSIRAEENALALELTCWLRNDTSWGDADQDAWFFIEVAKKEGVDPRQLYWLIKDGQFTLPSIIDQALKEGLAEEKIPEYWYLDALKSAKGENHHIGEPSHGQEILSHLVSWKIQEAVKLCKETGNSQKAKLFQATLPFLYRYVRDTDRAFWASY